MEFDTSDVEIEVEFEIPIDMEDVEEVIPDIGRIETAPVVDAVPVVIDDNWCPWPRRAA